MKTAILLGDLRMAHVRSMETAESLPPSPPAR
jgi:hypothetical protein